MRPLIAALLILAPAVLHAQGGRQTVRVNSSSASHAELLAVIDHGSNVVPVALVQRYDRALDVLSGRCTQSRGHISDMSVRSREQLRRDFGKRATPYAFLSALIAATDGRRQKSNCAELLAAITVMMGRSTGDAH